MPNESKVDIRENLKTLAKEVEQFFNAASDLVKNNDLPPRYISGENQDFFWDQLPGDLQKTANNLIRRLLPICGELAELARSSTLTGSEDLRDIKISTKSMKAALRLRRYSYREPEVIHDEGVVLGFRPADQSEDLGLPPRAAESEFFQHFSMLGGVLRLIEAGTSVNSNTTPSSPNEPSKYRAGTAFIMMWMDPKQPELTDVADTVRSVFQTFGIRAVRADDIEHEGLITQRVLAEIRTSEFLFADLTGTRPNVYYEIGYAHAFEKRVILFRKSGTGIHFDLAGYNCPEYENLRDLREKLSKRLTSITNRDPNEDPAQ